MKKLRCRSILLLSFLTLFLFLFSLSFLHQIHAKQEVAKSVVLHAEEESILQVPPEALPAQMINDILFLNSNGLWQHLLEGMRCTYDSRTNCISLKYRPIALESRLAYVGAFTYGMKRCYAVPGFLYKGALSSNGLIDKNRNTLENDKSLFLLPYPDHSSAVKSISSENVKAELKLYQEMMRSKRSLEAKSEQRKEAVVWMAKIIFLGTAIALLSLILYRAFAFDKVEVIVNKWRRARERARLMKRVEAIDRTSYQWLQCISLFKEILSQYVDRSLTLEEIKERGVGLKLESRFPSFKPLLQIFLEEAYQIKTESDEGLRRYETARKLLHQLLSEVKS